MYKLSDNLLKKSVEAFLLSLELFNKPTNNYRTESFSMLFCNSWELLLKSHIYQRSEGKRLSIFRKKVRGKRRESISLDECLNNVFINQNDPVRRNIEYISEIRNEASHLVVQELDPFFSRTFQSGVINYIDLVKLWFSKDVSDRLSPGLVSLITDKGRLTDISILKRKYSKEDFVVISGWIDKFNQLEKLGEKAAISIKHTIAIVKNPKHADIVISSGQIAPVNAVLVEKVKNPDDTHIYNRSGAILEIKKRIPKNLQYNQRDYEAYLFVMGYKKTNNDRYWKGRYSGAGQYSQSLVDEIIESIKSDPNNLKRWRSQYRQHLKRQKRN